MGTVFSTPTQRAAYLAFEIPWARCWLHCKDAAQVHDTRLSSASARSGLIDVHALDTRLNSTSTRGQEDILAPANANVNALWHVMQNDTTVRSDRLSAMDLRLSRVELDIHDLHWCSSDNAWWQICFGEDHVHSHEDRQNSKELC